MGSDRSPPSDGEVDVYINPKGAHL